MNPLLRTVTPRRLIVAVKKRLAVLRRYAALHRLDRHLERHLPFDGGFFVELGAHDGITQSNSYYFERHRHWKGILVEPTHENYVRAVENRSPDTCIVEAACVSFEYDEPTIALAVANLHSSSLGIPTDVADPMGHVSHELPNLKLDSAEIRHVRAVPLNDILDACGAPPRIDFLSLDVEGAELEVLRGVRHEAYRFSYLCIECRDLPRMEAYLTQHGYVLMEPLSHHDHLFRDSTLGDPPNRSA